MVTDMRLFASMRARVYSQGAALNEALVAILDITMIRSLIGMYAIMATKIWLAIERLATILPRTVEVAPTARSHDCERVGGSSFKLRGKRVAGAKRRGDKKGSSSKEKKKK
jgi:hypothetical protein